jgi:hypothetical protein
MNTKEGINALNNLQEKTVLEISSVKINYEMGFISRTEYLAQVSDITNYYNKQTEKIFNESELNQEFYAGYQFAKMQ